MDTKDQLDSLIEAYNNVFKQCYDALAEDAPQETRDKLREAIADFVQSSAK